MHEIKEPHQKIYGFDNNIGSSYEDYEKFMTRKATNIVAAAIISRADFPESHTLPRFCPTPYNNFGQYFLFDYERLLRILGDSIEFFKGKISVWSKILPWLVLVFSSIIIVIGMSSSNELILLTPIPIVLFFVTRAIIRNRFRIKYSEYRAKKITQLLDDSWSPNFDVSNKLELNLVSIGTGDIARRDIPILIIYDKEHPFPGFGQLQMDNLFICCPKNKVNVKNLTENQLFHRVTCEIENDIKNSGLQNFKTGHIISIHGESLTKKSNWLDSNKVPLLTYKSDNLFDYSEIDRNCSSRLFFVVQILLPKHMTAASFFIRIYKAENAIACQISLTTLGPPIYDKGYIMKRLAKYKSERKKKDSEGPLFSFIKSFFTFSNKRVSTSKIFRELKMQGDFGRHDFIFSKNQSLRKIAKLDPLYSKIRRHSEFNKIYRRIISDNVYWPGMYYYPLNFREENSLTFTSDYFGRPEAISASKAIYDQISRSILDSFENLGFDISDYKSKDGNYAINASKIEQLIVGEKISVKSKKENKNKKT